MAGLYRSEVSFRRQGSSGLVWDDKFLNQLIEKEENNKVLQQEGGEQQQEGEEQQQEQVRDVKTSSRTVGLINTIERSPSNGGGRAFRTGRVPPAVDPPSPKVSACGFCSTFQKTDKARRRTKSGKRRI